MHIPDGFLDPYISALTYIIMFPFLIYSFKRASESLDEKMVPFISVLASSIFVAQLVDWPIPGGTTAHFVGSGFLSIVVGFYLGVIIMFLVLFLQAILFQDGGITTLGANVLNMGVIGCGVGYITFKFFLERFGKKNIFLASFISGWLSITIAAIACGFEIGVSKNIAYGVNVAVPAMGIAHAILGILEGLITAFSVEFLARSRPDIIKISG